MASDEKKQIYSFMLDPGLALELKRIKARDGISESEQIRRGIRLWLESQAPVKAGRKRAPTRRRPKLSAKGGA